jgi:hypothetical protein
MHLVYQATVSVLLVALQAMHVLLLSLIDHW